VTTLTVALAVTLALLIIAGAGDAHLVKKNRRLRFELEDARNEAAWQARRRHPAGRGLRVVPSSAVWQVDVSDDLRRALEERDRGGAS
jgi:hypothetical protein